VGLDGIECHWGYHNDLRNSAIVLDNIRAVIELTMKLNIQLPDVASALVGARILRGTISAGYSQVMPSL
jgi:hypothetical protein